MRRRSDRGWRGYGGLFNTAHVLAGSRQTQPTARGFAPFFLPAVEGGRMAQSGKAACERGGEETDKRLDMPREAKVPPARRAASPARP